MLRYLYYYDIYPKVFPVGKETEITVRPLSNKKGFEAGTYKIIVVNKDLGCPCYDFSKNNHTDYEISTEKDGYLHFVYMAALEGEYSVRIFIREDNGDYRLLTKEPSVYAVEKDLADRVPLKGDFHLHTTRSDGADDPGTVCAAYRRRGYDFLAVTDHNKYAPSLEARKIYSGLDMALNILLGEEAEIPFYGNHVLCIGADYSVCGLIEDSPNEKAYGRSLEVRSSKGYAPDVLAMEEYTKQIEEIKKNECRDCPEDVDKTLYACAVWLGRRVREAGGMTIFAHPYWLYDVYFVPEKTTRYLLEKEALDAFEVLGGELYYEQNGFQTALYYDEYKNGRVLAITGNTDSHCSNEHNVPAGTSCHTIVFAHSNTKDDIISAVKGRYSVAVDTISPEYRIVGELRYQKYARFLLDCWFPIHNRVAEMDGELMREYYLGEADASEIAVMKKKQEDLYRKYFVFGN